jgi:transcriptional regulator with XRE-family HTH domain
MSLEFKVELGRRLRAARERARLTVKEMAQTLEVSLNTVYAYENGQNQAPTDVVVAYARVTGESMGRLGGLEPDPQETLNLIAAAAEEAVAPPRDLSGLSDRTLSALIVTAGIEVHKRLRRPE